MKLILVRHAIAEEREEFAASGLADDLRPISEVGRRKMEQGARGLATLLPGLDRLVSSPLVRARQTAEIVAAAFGGTPIVETATLAPGAEPGRFLDWLAGRRWRAEAVAAVGHQPHLGRLAAHLLAGGDPSAEAVEIEFKKGNAALFEVGEGPAVLRWLLAPAYLRSLGRLAG